MPSVEKTTLYWYVANLPEPVRVCSTATRPVDVPAIESTNATPAGGPALRHCRPSELVQTVSEGTVAEGLLVIATRPVGETATSTLGAVMEVTWVHVWPSAEVQTKELDAPFLVP